MNYVADCWQDDVHRKGPPRTTNKKVAVARATRLAADLTHAPYRKPPPAVAVRQAVDEYTAFLATLDRAHKTLVRHLGEYALYIAYLAGHGMAGRLVLPVGLWTPGASPTACGTPSRRSR